MATKSKSGGRRKGARRLELVLTDEQGDRYAAAAERAGLPVGTWAKSLLDPAAALGPTPQKKK